MYFSLKMVPVQMQKVGEFVAPNPWTGNPREQWTTNVYGITSETFAANLKWANFNKQKKNPDDLATRRAKVQGRKMKYGQTVGFESPDGRIHMLPRKLLELWQTGQVPDQALPGMLHQFEPVLKKSDFRMYRRRLIFKVEAYLFLVFALIALAVVVADKTLDTGHRQTQPKQAAWLAQPMKGETVWVQGPGVKPTGCFKLHDGTVKVPDGLHTYGTLGLVCGFQAQNESRLMLTDVEEAEMRRMAPDSPLILRGVVMPPGQIGLSPKLMAALGQRLPGLNQNYVFVYNVDYGNPDGFSLGEAAPIVAWAALGLSIPFWAYLLAASFWRKRDAWLAEQFRGALWQTGAAQGLAPALSR
jgi:hypothetical protein